MSETQRAVNAPSRPLQEPDPLGWALRLALSGHLIRTPNGPVLSAGFPLPRPPQAQAWSELEAAGGLLAGVGCGDGKTLIGLLAPMVLALSPTLYLVPAGLLPEVEKERARWSRYYKLPDALLVYSYEKLSRPAAARFLEDYQPRVIIADEAHWIANRDSTRWGRLWRYLEEHGECVFVDMTGTITGRSLREFAHRSFAALGTGSPLPADRYHLEDWAECLDSQGRPTAHQWRRLKPLVERWGRGEGWTRNKERKAVHRRALRRRLEATPGVILTRKGSTSASLVLHLWRDLEVPEEVSKALKTVERGESPDGCVFESDADQWRASTEVLAGFWYQWDWSRWTGSYHQRDAWLEARSDWARYVRRELRLCSGPGYDSPSLVRDHVKNAVCAPGPCRAVGGIYDAWRRWAPLSSIPAPPTIARPLSTYLVDHAVRWANAQPEPVLLWYRDKHVGQLLQERGVPAFGSGTQPPDLPITCALSIGAHGRGRNLQDRWRLSLVLQPLSSGKRWEQMLARTHRPGQPHPSVEWAVYQHHAILRRALARATEDASYTASITGNAQRLLFADRVVSPAGSSPLVPPHQ